MLESATHGHHFTVAQVQQLLPLFDFSGERLHAVRLLRPRILDMQNAYLLYGSFEYSNDKAEPKKILGVRPYGLSCVSPSGRSFCPAK